MRETVRELGERRATGFLKKFYGWYLGRGRFPRPAQAGARPARDDRRGRGAVVRDGPGARFVLARIEQEQPEVDDTLLADMPISIYGGG